LLQNRQVDGIVLLATNTDEDLIREIQDSKVPVVVIGQEVPHDSGIPSVVFDDYGAAVKLMEALIGSGRRKIGYVGVEAADQAVGVLRKRDYLYVMEHHGRESGASSVQTGDFSIESGYEAASRMFADGKGDIDAIFAATDRMGIGVWNYLKEAGFSVPGQVAIVGIGSSETSRFIDPAMTTIEYEFETAGRAGAEILLSILNGSDKRPDKKVLDFKLVTRDSL